MKKGIEWDISRQMKTRQFMYEAIHNALFDGAKIAMAVLRSADYDLDDSDKINKLIHGMVVIYLEDIFGKKGGRENEQPNNM